MKLPHAAGILWWSNRNRCRFCRQPRQSPRALAPNYPGTIFLITTDQRGEPLDSPPDIGAFQISTGLLINTATDAAGSPAGKLSLRQAVNLANVLDVAETITFDSTVFATAQTITLAQGQLELADTGGTETITGPPGGVTVSGGGLSRVFQVDATVTASISGLTISGGSTTGNGGGLADDGTATLTECTISGNSANDGGGLVIGGTASLTGCTIGGNHASGNGGGLYNTGMATLEDTIVAGNTGSGSSASDIQGSVASSSLYNLIGTGGSGGLTNGTGNNIVLSSLATLRLAPLGNYGGATETMALLPGSAAIGAGIAVSGVTTDERGASRPTPGAVDIGAFQDQGYTVAVSSGSPQSALVSQAFNAPIVALFTENFASAPLPGETIDFTAPSSGASATLSTSSAVTSASGLASVTATAKSTAGAYAVTASATEVTSSASFNLTNQIQPIFSGLTGQSITYGSTVTFTGTLAAGSVVPVGQEVAVTVDGATHDATIAAAGSFSTQFTRADVVLNASSTAYTVTYAYASDGIFLADNGSSQLTVSPEAITITAVANSKVYDGTTSAAAVPTITSGSLATGDTADFTETYSTRNVGTGLTLKPSGTVNDDNGGENYTYTFVAVSTGVITPAALTITADDQTKAYGAALPRLTAAYSGFVDGDTSASLTTLPTVTTTATAVSHVSGNPYSITASGAADSEYTISYVPGTLTVTPVALTITANSQTKAYGAGLPTLTALYSGFVNGDTSASLTTLATVTTTATAASHVSGDPYSITASGAADSDYTISYAPGTLTVTPVALTITANSQIKAYGAGLPTLTVSYSGFVDGDTSDSLTTLPTVTTTATAASHVSKNPYSITAAGAVDSDYTISYVPGTLTVTPAALTITAKNQTKAYSAALPALTASYSGFVNGDNSTSLTTHPTVTTTATAVSHVSGDPYPITASGAADSDYTISYVPGTLTVAPVALTITANSQSEAYGAALPTLTASYSGFVNGDNSTSLTTHPTVTTTATAVSHVSGGPYPITASGAADSDYTISYVPGTLTVAPVALTITANSQSKAYGAALPTLTASYSGFVNGDNFGSLTVLPTVTSAATAASHVTDQPYSITASGAVDSDYTISYAAGTLTVTPVALIINTKSQTKAYGAPLPTLIASYSAFVNGDTSASLTMQPKLTTTATADSHVTGSPYAITVSGAVDSDYSISYVAGSLTVLTAALTITANNQTKVYAAALPTLTASYSGFVNRDTSASLTTQPALHSTATPSSAPGNYPVTVGGASSPNYTITYVPGTLTVILAPATVESISVEKITLSKHKKVQGIVLQFSEALDSADAQDINSYTLATVPKNKKRKSNPVPLSNASYNASAFTVTLLTRKKLALNPPLDLTVKATSVLDALGRELDGNDSGQPGANFTAVLSKAGTSGTSARALARIGGLSSRAVDAVLKAGLRGDR